MTDHSARIASELRESAALKLRVGELLVEGIARAGEALLICYQRGGKVLLCGNGGSAADCQHLAAELMARYRHDRLGLPAIALTTDTSLLTAVSNDDGYEWVFARQVETLGSADDVLVAISTSGRSPNVNRAVGAARDRRMVTIGLTGGDGGELAQLVDLPLIVPSDNTARVQECHITIGHILCGIVEDWALQRQKGR